MKTSRGCLVVLLMLFAGLLSGCGNFSPRDNGSPQIKQEIDNQNGRIDRIENNQNAIRLEIDRRNVNSGWQILQGDGSLLLVFGLAILLAVTIYYYRANDKSEKIIHLLLDQIKAHNDPVLEERIFSAALYSDVEKDVFKRMFRR